MQSLDNNLSLLDALTILGFCIGLQNLEINLGQNDLDRQTADLDARVNERLSVAIADLHNHLAEQDAKIERILELLNETH